MRQIIVPFNKFGSQAGIIRRICSSLFHSQSGF